MRARKTKPPGWRNWPLTWGFGWSRLSESNRRPSHYSRIRDIMPGQEAVGRRKALYSWDSSDRLGLRSVRQGSLRSSRCAYFCAYFFGATGVRFVYLIAPFSSLEGPVLIHDTGSSTDPLTGQCIDPAGGGRVAVGTFMGMGRRSLGRSCSCTAGEEGCTGAQTPQSARSWSSGGGRKQGWSPVRRRPDAAAQRLLACGRR